MAKTNLKKISVSKVKIFKINNRKGYAAVCLNNLTEGNTTLLTQRDFGINSTTIRL